MTGNKVKLGLIPSNMSAMVDLRGSSAGFSEKFFIVVAERTAGGALMHLWQLELSSTGLSGEETPQQEGPATASHVEVSSAKVSSQALPLPPVESL